MSLSSSCRAVSTDIPDPLSPLFLIVHRLQQVFRATSLILTQLLNVCSSWSSCFCPAICGSPQEYIPYEVVPASPAVSCMSGSSNLDSFCDRRQVAVQLVPCGVLPPGLVQYCSQHSCVIAVYLLFQLFCQRPSSASIQQYRYDRCREEFNPAGNRQNKKQLKTNRKSSKGQIHCHLISVFLTYLMSKSHHKKWGEVTVPL